MEIREPGFARIKRVLKKAPTTFLLLAVFFLTAWWTMGSAAAGDLTPFSDSENLWGYKDSAGRTVVPPQYRMAFDFSDQGIAAVVDDKGWLYIDRQGRERVRPFVYDNGPDYFEEGAARYVENGKIGFINTRAEVIIPARFDFAWPFFNGRAVVCMGCTTRDDGDEHKVTLGGKWGYINRQGGFVIPPAYDHAGPFMDGWSMVKKDGREFAIDHQGREIERP